MAMLEGASFSFTIGYKTCTWKKKNVDWIFYYYLKNQTSKHEK
jgi:hypothetical protein